MGRMVDAAVRRDPQPAPSWLTARAGPAPSDGFRTHQPPPSEKRQDEPDIVTLPGFGATIRPLRRGRLGGLTR
jgi:hypothetical protein